MSNLTNQGSIDSISHKSKILDHTVDIVDYSLSNVDVIGHVCFDANNSSTKSWHAPTWFWLVFG